LIYYLDTSVVVAVLTPEVHSERVEAWMTDHLPVTLSISEWVSTELSAALSIKLRRGDINETQRTNALATFAELFTGGLTILPISTSRFQVAARFADIHSLGLRGGDALHLAICAEHGATLCTLDRQLSGAGPALGVATTLV
jgi:uncharacterized protein